jgi:hypothetical protein
MTLPLQTLPLLGVINVTVGQAPFQFPYSAPNLGKPYFLNGTSQVGSLGLSPGANGYWGLQYLYGNIPMSSGSPTSAGFANTSGMSMFQYAGGVVQSFGVFDYLALASNPFRYNPVTTNFYNGGAYSIAQGLRSSLYMPNELGGGTSVQYKARFQLPYFMTQNINAPFGVTDSWDIYNVPFGSTSQGAISFPDPVSGQQIIANNVVLTGGVGVLNNMVYIKPTGTGPATQIPLTVQYFGQTYGVYAGNNNHETNELSLLSPNHYIWLQMSNVSGLCYMPLFTQQTLAANNPSVVARVPLQFSEAVDNTLFQPRTYNGLGLIGTTIPGGDFLISNNGAFGDGGPIYFYIKGDMTGYYRVIFTGTNATIQAVVNSANRSIGVSGGFGVDLNGNVWFIQRGQQQPLLYSSLNLVKSLSFPIYPNVNNRGIACRRNIAGPCSRTFEG